MTEEKTMAGACIMHDAHDNEERMYCIEKINWDPENGFNSDIPHPAFRAGDKTKDAIYAAQYQAINIGGHARSLPGMTPMTFVNYDDAKKMCEAKGRGWHLLTQAELHAIALIAMRDGTIPLGNTNRCKSHSNPDIIGIPANSDKDMWLTGSGGPLTSHNHKDGIYDLVGNINEWIDGYKLQDNRLAVNSFMQDGVFIPDNDFTRDEKTWPDFTAPVTPTNRYKDLNLQGRESKEVVKALRSIGLLPMPEQQYGDDYAYISDCGGERLPFFGGDWVGTSDAGLFALNLYYARTGTDYYIGFRFAYGDL